MSVFNPAAVSGVDVAAAPVWVAVGGAAGLAAGALAVRTVPFVVARGSGRPTARVARWALAPVLAGWFALLVWRFGHDGAWAVLPAYLGLAVVGAVLAAVDADVHRLPDVLVLPAYPALLALLALASAVVGDWAALLRAVLAGAVALVGYLALALLAPGGGLGLGDVKLAGLLGLALGWLGWGAVLIGVYAGFLVGGLVALTMLAARRVGWRGAVAYGPSMLVGAGIGLVVPAQSVADALLP